MAYLLLLGAIFAEVAATLLALSISCGMQTDVAYALWSAIGTAAIVLIAVLFLDSPVSVAKVAGVGLIIGGAVTLNLAGAHWPRLPLRRGAQRLHRSYAGPRLTSPWR